jgi:uncharacterized protein YjbJ (UPF0337 family)
MVSADPTALRWRSLAAAAKARWPELTEPEIAAIAGDRARLEAALQTTYGRSREQAAAEIDHWLTRLGAACAAAAPTFASRATA